jgi:pyridoxal phosphate enzyme (YggS family)
MQAPNDPHDRDDEALPELRRRLDRVRDQVAVAARKAGRQPEEVTIVGVTKTVDREIVDAAYAVGLRDFGENRVQEAGAKFGDPLPADANLHLIGQLQSNKAKAAVRLFGLIESVDRRSLIEALDRATVAQHRELPVLIQVNIAEEPQKAGCSLTEVAALAQCVKATALLRPVGLMTIAPLVADPEEVRTVFRALRRLRDRLSREVPGSELRHLSMGMSNDFQVAIEEGATMVRIGRAIFGERS